MNAREMQIASLLERGVYVIDMLPDQVPAADAARYFAAEAYWMQSGTDAVFRGKLSALLIRLSCYYSVQMLKNGESAGEFTPAALAGLLREFRPQDMLHLLLDGGASLLMYDGSDLYASVYAPDETMQRRLGQLAAAEGLFFRPGASDISG